MGKGDESVEKQDESMGMEDYGERRVTLDCII